MAAALPEDFVSYTRDLFGEELYGKFVKSFDVEPPVSIRINPFKMEGVDFSGDPVPWCRGGVWLDFRPDFTLDPLFHAGCYYVQEAGSMFLDRVLERYAVSPVRMLDLCAAPGGKATLARAALPAGSLLYCNDTDRRRANILVENIQKQGHRDVVVTCNRAPDYRKAGLAFDVILADVPCSGEGMFRKDAAAAEQWSAGNVLRCAGLQREILSGIWPCLKSGGILVYSTCTFNTRENEENVRWITENLGAEALEVKTDSAWHITGSLLEGFRSPVYRFIPGVTRSEGLFMAVLRKTSDDEVSGKPRRDRLRVLYDGRNITNTGNVPPHAGALLCGAPAGGCPAVELTREEALAYLRREALRLKEDIPAGLVVVRYMGHALGYVRNIGTRANNLYPREWRIRCKSAGSERSGGMSGAGWNPADGD